MSKRTNEIYSFTNIGMTATSQGINWQASVSKLDGTADVNTDWLLALGSGGATPYDKLADALSSAGAVAPGAAAISYTNAEAYGQIVSLAFRMPTVTKICELTALASTNPPVGSEALTKVLSDCRIYTSGRSDKIFSEISEWVAVYQASLVHAINVDPDNQLLRIPYSFRHENGFLNDSADAIERYPSSRNGTSRVATEWHARFFPTRAAWVRVDFVVMAGKTLTIEQLGVHEFIEDPATGTGKEENPDISLIPYPPVGAVFLPSQTVFFTAQVRDLNGDHVHFRFEIWKDTNPADGALGANRGVYSPYTIYGQGDIVALVQGGQRYKCGRTTVAGEAPGGTYVAPVITPWMATTETGDLQVATVDSNAFELDGSINENWRRNYFTLLNTASNASNKIFLRRAIQAKTLLLVPKGTAGINYALSSVKVYRVGSDTPCNTVTLAGNGSTVAGWVIPADVVPTTSREINKIELTNVAGVTSPVQMLTDFYLYAVDQQIGAGIVDPTHVSWAGSLEYAWIAKIEYCWPKSTPPVPNTVPPTVSWPDGYDATVTGDLLNPENNGKSPLASRVGEWRTVPPFQGLHLRQREPGSAGFGGDSPLTDNTVFVRLSLPDPFSSGERYFFKPGVWDGQVTIV